MNLKSIKKIFTYPRLESLLSLVTRNQRVDNLFWGKLLIPITPDETLYKHGSYREVVRNKVKMKLDLSQRTDNGIYFGFIENAFLVLYEAASKSDVIIDVGANILNTSLFMSTHNPDAKILAFEPDPQTYKRALENLNFNPRLQNNISLFNLGLGDKNAVLSLYRVDNHNSGMNRIYDDDKMGETNVKSVKVEVTTLDDLVSSQNLNKVDLIKIDVEGFELKVLKGASSTLRMFKPKLFVEVDDANLKQQNSSAAELLKLVLDLGYQIQRADTGTVIDKPQAFENCHFDIICQPI